MPTLPQTKVRRTFPLTSIEKIEYKPDSKEPGPRVFKLIFPTDIITLQAESKEDANDWVEKIENGSYTFKGTCTLVTAIIGDLVW